MPFFPRSLFLHPAAILATIIAHAHADLLLGPRDGNNTSVPAPLHVSPSQSWDGIDGSWSTFTLSVGTPSQSVRTLISFKSYQTWAVLPQGCQAAEDQNACADDRGWLFNETASTTFDRIGIYNIGIEQNLGLDGNAIFGYEIVGLGGQGEDGPTLRNTTVGGLAVEEYYLGVFGVNPKPTNFTSFNDGSPSYMTQLKEQNYIPSVSFGYTAGARYRSSSGVQASLVLGGYDSARFIENDLTFPFAGDNSRDLVVAIQSITTPSTVASSPAATELLPAAIYAYIDSTVAEFWLPLVACQAFELEFGLVYDNTSGLYLVNDTLHEALLSRGANVTFTLSPGLTGSPTVNIVLPYAAFDLEAQAPYKGLSNTTRYFPLQRAQNETQYTLGRAFMQEAYIAVDWESQSFNVSQVNWAQTTAQHLVPILATETNSSGAASNDHSSFTAGASAGVIAGIAVGVIAAVAIIVLAVIFVLRRRKSGNAADDEKRNVTSSRAGQDNVLPKAELEGSTSHALDHRRLLSANSANTTSMPGTPHSGVGPAGAGYFAYINGHSQPTTPGAGDGTHSSTQSSKAFSPTSDGPSEADSRERRMYEMPGDTPIIGEKDGKALSEKEAIERRQRIYNGVDSGPDPSAAVNEGVREPRRIDPADVVRTNVARPDSPEESHGPRRAFSFELERGSHTEEHS